MIQEKLERRQNFISVDGKMVINSYGDYFKVGEVVGHEGAEERDSATIEGFELDVESNEIKVTTDKGYGHIDFLIKLEPDLIKPIFRLAAKMLNLASDEFSNHGCNDLDEDTFSDLSDEEKEELRVSYKKYYGDDEYPTALTQIGDSELMSYLSDKFLKHTNG